MTDASAVEDSAEKSRFELAVENQIAFAAYSRRGDVLLMTHTEVPDALQGRGVASALIGGALIIVRERGERIVPLCQFVAAYMERHPDQADLVAD